jgi:hypothetical protein
MSSDFSIKPAGAPGAAPMLQPAPAAAGDAVATDLPAHQSVAAADAGVRLRHDPQSSGGDTSNNVVIDRDAGAVVYQVVDNRTNLVVKQFPDQAVLRRRAYFRALDLMASELLRSHLTDRQA